MAADPDGVLSFAPNGYFMDRDKSYSWPGIPESIPKRFSGQASKVYCVTIGSNNNFVCCWRDKDQTGYIWSHLPDYPKLKEYWAANKDKKTFLPATIHCSLGPNESFYINSEAGQYKHGLDNGLNNEINRRLTEDNHWDRDPIHITIGVDKSYVLVGRKGDVFWDLKGHYGQLDKLLTEANTGIKTITLSAFNKEHFYVLFKSGKAHWGSEWDLTRWTK